MADDPDAGDDDDGPIQIGGYYDDEGNDVSHLGPEIEDAEPAPILPFPVAREKAYRELEAKCAKLESMLARKTSLDLPSHGQEKHQFRCGQHPRVIVSETTPKVWCAVCEEELDPVSVLRQYARKERNFVFGLEHDRREAAALTKEIEELKRIRSNLKSQLRRATKP